MADQVIGALRVLLGLDTAAFSTGAKQAESALGKLESQFKSAAKTIGVGLGVGAIVNEFRKVINAADEMNKASQKFGIGTEALSGLKYAAELADVSFEALGKGLKKLAQATVEGISKPGSEAAQTFKALGISIDELKGKSPDQVMLKVADAFARFDDDATKTVVAVRLFGKAGADLIPLLNQGSEGIRKQQEEARQLGLVMSKETTQAAEDFNDALKAVEKTIPGIVTILVGRLAPGLKEVTRLMREFVESGAAKDAADAIGGTLKQTAKDVQQTSVVVQYGIAVWEKIKEVWENIGDEKKQEKAVDDLGAAITSLGARLQKTHQDAAQFWSAFPVGAFDAITSGFGNTAAVVKDKLNPALLASKDSFDKWLQSQQRSAAAQSQMNLLVQQGVGVGEVAKFMIEAQSKSVEELGHKLDETNPKVIAARDAIKLLAETTQLKQFVEEGLSDWDRYQQKLADVQARMAQFPQFTAQLTNALKKIQLDMQNNLLSSLATALGQFSQLFQAFGTHNKKMFALYKAFAIAEATVNTYKAANNALASPYPWPLPQIFAAAAVAAGIANVIKISSQQMPAAATGGSFRVAGGSMGVDTRMVSMALSPGELVDVTPASKAESGGGVLEIKPIRPSDLFSGENMRILVERMDSWMREGGTGVRFAKVT